MVSLRGVFGVFGLWSQILRFLMIVFLN